MIERVLLSERTYYAGEQIALTAWGDNPMTAEILCFVTPPLPPSLKPCDECGIFNITSGIEFSFRANLRTWIGENGHLIVKIVDATGDSYEAKIEIEGMTRTRVME